MKRIAFASLCFLFLVAASVSAQSNDAKKLFDNKNPDEWAFHVDKEGVGAKDVFSFNGDVLACKGQPFGYLATKENYKNFKLSLEYRWPTGVQPTNSGIFLRITDQPEKTFLPKCFEVQLAHGSAGDLWGFHGRNLQAPINSDPKRFISKEGGPLLGTQKGVKRFIGAENEAGQWNSLDILCCEGLIVIVMNGKIVNWITDAEIVEGQIGFQSEGGPIEFRSAQLTVLP